MNKKIEINNKEQLEESASQWLRLCILDLKYKRQKLEKDENRNKNEK